MPDTDVSNLNLIGYLFVLLMGLLTILLPRRFATLPVMVTCCFMTVGQQAVIGGFHFSVLRIVIFFGWLRVFVRHEFGSMKLNTIDKVMIIYTCVGVLNYVLLWGTFDALKNRLGFTYNVIGIYFLFRFLIKDFEDIRRIIRIISVFLIPLAGLMILEKLTGKNIFYIFGGVPEITIMRGEYPRCQGPFGHAILAGTFGAALMPLIVPLVYEGNNTRFLGKIGIAAATMICIAAHSSGPLIAYSSGFISLIMWHFRRHMRAIRWGIIFMLIGLHLIMNAPVWFLISKMAELVGGGGYHRAALIDQAITHFDEWWLLGTKYTAHWMPYSLSLYPDSADITNQYIAEGISGGLIKMILFISIIVLCFKALGKALMAAEEMPFAVKITFWSMGAALITHVMSFFSVSYFDQIIVIWYLLLAMISRIHGMSPEAIHEGMK